MDRPTNRPGFPDLGLRDGKQSVELIYSARPSVKHFLQSRARKEAVGTNQSLTGAALGMSQYLPRGV